MSLSIVPNSEQNLVNFILEIEKNIVYAFKMFFVKNKKIMAPFILDHIYEFEDLTSVEKDSNQKLLLNIPFFTKNKNNVYEIFNSKYIELVAGYHVVSLFSILEYYNEEDFDHHFCLVSFPFDYIQFYDGLNLVVKKFTIVEPEKVKEILEMVKQIYKEIIPDYSEFSKRIISDNEKIIKIIKGI